MGHAAGVSSLLRRRNLLDGKNGQGEVYKSVERSAEGRTYLSYTQIASVRVLMTSGRVAAISLYTAPDGDRLDSPPLEAHSWTYSAKISQTSLW